MSEDDTWSGEEWEGADYEAEEGFDIADEEPGMVARVILEHRFDTGDPLRKWGILWWRGGPWEWGKGGRWVQRDRTWMEDYAWTALMQARITANPADPHMYKPTIHKVANVVRATQALTTLRHDDVPFDLSGKHKIRTSRAVSFRDRVVDAGTWETWDRGPWWFDPVTLPVDWDPESSCPTWENCVKQWSDGDDEWAEVLRRFLGYAIMPHRELQRWVLLYGKVRAGKGTIMAVLRMLLGDGFSGTSLENVSQRFGLWGVEHSRVLSVGEVTELASREAETACGVVKSIVGGDPVFVDRKNAQASRNVVLPSLVVMQANEIPTLPDKSRGLSSKMVVLPFRTSFLGKEDFGLLEKLRDELPGIAAWAMRGARDLEAEGDPKLKLRSPACAEDAVGMYVESSNPFGEFLRAEFFPDAESYVTSKELAERWDKWRAAHGGPKLNTVWAVRRAMEEDPWGTLQSTKIGGTLRVIKGIGPKVVSGSDDDGD